jgi:hypothetical protein
MPASSRTSSSIRHRPVRSVGGREHLVRGVCHDLRGSSRAIDASPPSRFWTAAVAIKVRGHSVLDAMPSCANSAANPSAARVIPYLASMYPTLDPSQRGARFNGGERVNTWASALAMASSSRTSATIGRTRPPYRLDSCRSRIDRPWKLGMTIGGLSE